MSLERSLKIARKIITRRETEREAIKRTLSDSESRQEFKGAIDRGHIEPDDYPNAHFKLRRRINFPFKVQYKHKDFEISTIADESENPHKDS